MAGTIEQREGIFVDELFIFGSSGTCTRCSLTNHTVYKYIYIEENVIAIKFKPKKKNECLGYCKYAHSHAYIYPTREDYNRTVVIYVRKIYETKYQTHISTIV